MKKTLSAALVLILLVGLIFFWKSRSAPETTPGAAIAVQTSPAAVQTAAQVTAEPGRCDQQPALPPLPADFAPTATDLPGLVRALDDALTDGHRAWIRCFTLDDELLARTHQGFGRWLRNTLQLSRRRPLMTAIGARNPDEASSLITLAYAYHLRGQELTPAEAKGRRDQAMIDAGVTP